MPGPDKDNSLNSSGETDTRDSSSLASSSGNLGNLAGGRSFMPGHDTFMPAAEHDILAAIRPSIDGISFPLTIFSEGIGSFEAIIKHLKDAYGLKNNELAFLTERSQKTIWGTYSNACQKSGSNWDISQGDISDEPHMHVNGSYSGIQIPLNILQDRELGVLEAISFHLKNAHSLKYCQIARLLQRDQRTIWTAVHRAKRKIARRGGQ